MHEGETRVVVFEPGYYDDAVGLFRHDGRQQRGSTARGGSSPARTTSTSQLGYEPHTRCWPTASNVWTIDDGYLVAGTTGRRRPARSRPPRRDRPRFRVRVTNRSVTPPRSACSSSSRQQPAEREGRGVEICGTYSASKPPVAIIRTRSRQRDHGRTVRCQHAEADPPCRQRDSSVRARPPPNLAETDGTAFASWKSTKTERQRIRDGQRLRATSAITPAGSRSCSPARVRVRASAQADAATSDSLSVTHDTRTAATTTGTGSADGAGGIGGTAFPVPTRSR
jgi:hypothetical protein